MLRVVSAVDISASLGFLEAIREGGRLSDSSWPSGKVQSPSYSERLQRKRRRRNLCTLYTDSKYACVGFEPQKNDKSPILSSFVASTTAGEVAISSEQKVYDVVLKQAALVKKHLRSNTALDVKPDLVIPGTTTLLTEAYDRCGEVCAEYAKTFYLGQLSYPVFNLLLFLLGFHYGIRNQEIVINSSMVLS